MLSETAAYVLFHLSRGNLRRHVSEVRQFDKIGQLAPKIAHGLETDGLLDSDTFGYAVTDKGRAALAEWRKWHEGDQPRPPWRRGYEAAA